MPHNTAGFSMENVRFMKPGVRSNAKRLTLKRVRIPLCLRVCPFVQIDRILGNPETENWFSVLFMKGRKTPGWVSERCRRSITDKKI